MAWYDFITHLIDKLNGNNKPRLKLFADEQKRWAATSQYERGLRVIEVDKIVGTVDRNRQLELDADFQYRNGIKPFRLRRILEALESGVILPPIEVDQIKDEYFVIDGHHRVAAAKEIGQVYIDASVREYLPDVNNPANTLFYERRRWKKGTGLRDIRLTEPGGYNKLLNRIKDYRKAQEQKGRTLSIYEAAEEWYSSEYLPVAAVIEDHHMLDRFEGRTVADVFVYIMDHRWLKSKRLGNDIGLQQAVADFVADFGQRTLADRAERMVEPIVRLGTNVIARARSDRHPNPLLSWMPEELEDDFTASLVVGLLSLPSYGLKKLRRRIGHRQSEQETPQSGSRISSPR